MKLESYSKSKLVTTANLLKRKNLYHFMRPITHTDGHRVEINGTEQIMIGSNNYLGLTHHPHVVECAQKAIATYGTGCTGSRFLNGNLTIHEELEERLAKFLGHESVICFATGMQANLGSLQALCGPKDLMLFDAENHASLLDASRLAFGTTFKYKHNNMENLEELLVSNIARFQKVIIVADGVFSMTGDILNLPKVVELAQKYGALIYIDDAHGLGVLGEKGNGTANHFELMEQVDFTMGTFSKSFASLGGLISGPKAALDHVRLAARSFMFSAAMAPSSVATVSACLDVIESDATLFDRLWDNVTFMRQGFEAMDVFTYNSKTPIIPVFIGDDIKAMQITQYLQEQGIFATPVISPAVPKGEALIRTSYMACHNKKDLTKVLEIFARAKHLFQIPSQH